MKNENIKLAVAILLIFVGVMGRMLPHMWNFTPIVAISLFSAFYLGRKYAVIVPLLAMFISDMFIGFYDPAVMISVYGSFALIGVLSFLFKGRRETERALLLSLGASTLFFLITNFSVWAFSGMYSPTLSGLAQSYIMAVPFYRNALLGDLFYTGIIFLSYATISNVIFSRKIKEAVIK